jgi:hypothetical protein
LKPLANAQLRAFLVSKMLASIIMYQVAAGAGSLIALALWSYQERARPKRPEEVLRAANVPLLHDQGSDLFKGAVAQGAPSADEML